MKEKGYIFAALLFLLLVFSWDTITKGYIIGPFDFLVNYYKPYLDSPVFTQQPELNYFARHFKNYLMSDVVTVVLPVKLLAIDMMKNGILPLWNPYLLNGTPLLASVQAAVLYPLNILYFLFAAPYAYTLYILLQIVGAFSFMALLLSSYKLRTFAVIFGATAFSLSAFMIVWLTWGTLGHALLWLPLILYAIRMYAQEQRARYAGIIMVALTCSFFAGHTQTSVMVWGVSCAYSIFTALRARSVKHGMLLIVPFVIALLISSIQLLPSQELYEQSARDSLRSEAFYRDQTLYPSSYLQLFIPDFFGNPVTRNWWGKINYAESAIYFGLTAIVFVGYLLYDKKKQIFRSPDILFFLTLALLGCMASIQSPLSRLLFESNLPLISSSTFARYSAIVIFCGALLSAFGFDVYLKHMITHDYKRPFFFGLGLVCLLALYWGLILGHILPTPFLEHISTIKHNSILPSLILCAIIGSMMAPVIVPSMRFIPFRSALVRFLSLYIPVALVLLLSVEMLRFAKKYTPFVPGALFYPQHELFESMSEITRDGRYMNIINPNTNATHHIAGFAAGEPLYNNKLSQLANMSVGSSRPQLRTGLSIQPGTNLNRILDLINSKYFLDKDDQMRNIFINEYYARDHAIFDTKFALIQKIGPYRVYENVTVVPRYALYYDTVRITDRNQRLEMLVSTNFDPRTTIVVEADLEKTLSKEHTGSVTLIEERPLYKEFEVQTNGNAILAIMDTAYPGWKAQIDGKDTPLIAVNHAFQGVAVSPENRNVTLSYEPQSVETGMKLAGLGIIAGICVLMFHSRYKFSPSRHEHITQ